jgi:predicted O-methyltransferase YrrM
LAGVSVRVQSTCSRAMTDAEAPALPRHIPCPMKDADSTQETWSAVDVLIERFMLPDDDVLAAVSKRCERAGLPSIAVSPSQGKLLHVLARMCGARRILEVGTLGGYSTIWLARALPPGGRLTTIEINPQHAEVAAENFRQAGLADRIDLRVGAAIEALPVIASERPPPFDLVFIDADKVNSAAYLRLAMPISRPGTVVIVDNVVRNGAVLSPEPDAGTRGAIEAMQLLGTTEGMCATAVQTVGVKGYDGFAIGILGGLTE